MGADHVIDSSRVDPVEEILRLTGGRGVNPNGRRPPRDVAAETRAAIEGAIGGIADGLS